MIPKLLHQIFYPFYFKELPDDWRQNIEVWKRLHPDYQHKLWGYDESLDFLKREYPWFVETWLNYPHKIQKCDAIRYFILYHYGGVYADLDLIPLRPIDPLMAYDALIPESTLHGISNSFLACVPGHQFFKQACLKLKSTVNKYWFFGKHLNVMYSTGPAFLEGIYKDYNGTDVFVICAKMYYGKCTNCSDSCNGILFGHTTGKSWHNGDSRVLNHVYCHLKEYIILVLLVLVVILWYYGFYRKCRVVCARG